MHLLTDKEFLELLSRLDVHVATNGEKLQISAPTGVLDEATRAEIARRKSRLIATLSSSVLRPSGQTIPATHATAAPLTFAQQRIWLIDRFHPGNIAYNIPEAFVIEHSVDLGIFRHAVEALAERHQVLKAHIEETDGEPVQRVSSTATIPIEFTDLSENAQAVQDRLLKEAILAAGAQPFDLIASPLIRFHLFRLGEKKHIVFFNVHHIIADRWSLQILRRELSAFYSAISAGMDAGLPSPPIQYLDYALWEKEQLASESVRHQLEYWRRQLDGMPTMLELPFSRPRTALQSFSGATQAVTISKQTADALHRLAMSEGASLFISLLAVFSVLLYRYSGQSDLCIGSPISSRNWVETESIIGLFINILPLRCKLDGSSSFRDILRATKETALGAYANSDVPFQKLVLELNPERDLGRSPFFQVMFALDSLMDQGDSSTEQLDAHPGISKYDLTLQLAEQPSGIFGVFEYRTDLFHAESIQQLSRHFSNLLQSIIAAPDRAIAELAMLSEDERDVLLSVWNQTKLDFPAYLTIKDLFESQAQKTPDATAAIFHHKKISYRQLNQRANQLAHMLIQAGAEPETLVGIYMERSIHMLVALIAVLKAGAAYVPLDPAYPEQRLKFMIEDSRLKICISQERLLSRLDSVNLDFVCCLDRDREKLASASIDNPSTTAQPENAAYVIYTSGSTGQPKGVVVEQRNTLSFLFWAHSIFSAEALTGVLASTSICFDLSIFEIFLPLCFGHTVILAEDILQIPNLPATEKITLLNSVPSAISALLKTGGLPKSLRVVNSAGEFLSASLVREIYKSGNVGQVYDLYGPTETTTYSTFALRSPDAPSTIGRPIANTRIYVLDSNLQPVPVHVAGEIYIAGAGVTRGYLNKPELTSERFVPLSHLGETGLAYKTGDLAKYLPDGNLVYIGRMDQQVKLRGHRIELGEIEAAMRSYPGIQDAIVMVDRNASLGDILVGYVAIDRPDAFDKHHLLAFLRERLPAYMVVSQVVALKSFPLTANGKVDRKSLPAAVAYPDKPLVSRPPSDMIERQLANIWEHCFERKPIGIDENFFEIGGHSLLAFRIFSLIQKHMGKTLMLSILFQAPTIASLAEVIREDGWDLPESPIRAIRLSGHKPAIYGIQHSSHCVIDYENLARHLSSDQPVYTIDMIQNHNSQARESAQSAYSYAEHLRRFQPGGHYYLCASAESASFAYEMAQELWSRDSQVILVLFDPDAFGLEDNDQEADSSTGLISSIRRLYRRTPSSRMNGDSGFFGGKILLFRSEQQNGNRLAYTNAKWLEKFHRGKITTRQIACPHGKLLAEPYAGITASLLETFLS